MLARADSGGWRHFTVSAVLVLSQAKALPFADSTFDTVVHTFGLCSENDPEAVLAELQRVCKADGRILLLEHGRSGYFGWLNSTLDDSAPSHAEKWGCWWNKDIAALVKASGLKLEYFTTWHFGEWHGPFTSWMTHWVKGFDVNGLSVGGQEQRIM